MLRSLEANRPSHLQRAASVAEISDADGMDVTLVRRIMRPTLPGPEVVEWLVGSPDAVLMRLAQRLGRPDAGARATRVSASHPAPATACGRFLLRPRGARSPPLQELPTTTDRL